MRQWKVIGETHVRAMAGGTGNLKVSTKPRIEEEFLAEGSGFRIIGKCIGWIFRQRGKGPYPEGTYNRYLLLAPCVDINLRRPCTTNSNIT
jgi:hypothetical protein